MSTSRVTSTPRMNLPKGRLQKNLLWQMVRVGRYLGAELGHASLRSAERARRPFPRILFLPTCCALPSKLSIGYQPAGFADYICDLGQVVLFLRRGGRYGGIQLLGADDGAVEIVEGFFIDDGGDFAGEASGAGVFVQD